MQKRGEDGGGGEAKAKRNPGASEVRSEDGTGWFRLQESGAAEEENGTKTVAENLTQDGEVRYLLIVNSGERK